MQIRFQTTYCNNRYYQPRFSAKPPMTPSGNYLLYLQRQSGLNQKEFAKETGISVTALCNFCRGKYNPTPEVMNKIEQVYKTHCGQDKKTLSDVTNILQMTPQYIDVCASFLDMLSGKNINIVQTGGLLAAITTILLASTDKKEG